MRSPRAFVSRLLRRPRGAASQGFAPPGFAPSGFAPPGVQPVPQGGAYTPQADGRPDTGEVVWAWVPYEENDGRGKDRPVLLVGRRQAAWLGLMLTSKDHDRDAAEEARAGRQWMDVGTGDWDRERRPSEVRLDRVIVLDEAAIRREGAALDQAMFDRVVAAARELHALD